MAYTKNATWVDGSTAITAAKLNHIEDGVAAIPPSFLIPSLPGGATRPAFNADAIANYSGTAYGTSYPTPAGVPISGIVFQVATAQAATTMNIGVYDCNAIGRPKTRLYTTTGIDVSTTGYKTVSFSATPAGGLLWVFFKCSSNDTTVRVRGYNNNIVDPFVAASTANGFEAQRACYISDTLPADAEASFTVTSNWSAQPGFHILYPN